MTQAVAVTRRQLLPQLLSKSQAPLLSLVVVFVGCSAVSSNETGTIPDEEYDERRNLRCLSLHRPGCLTLACSYQ